MTGLDLESFLRLLKADLSTWVLFGPALLGLGLLVWSCWGSRRVLRQCLVVSVVVHFGLVLFGSTIPAVRSAFGAKDRATDENRHVRQIRVAPLVEIDPKAQKKSTSALHPMADSSVTSLPSTLNEPRLDLVATPLAAPDAALAVPRPKVVRRPDIDPRDSLARAVPEPAAIPSRSEALRAVAPLEPLPDSNLAKNPEKNPPAPPLALAADLERADTPVDNGGPNAAPKIQSSSAIDPSGRPDIALRSDRRLRPIQATNPDSTRAPGTQLRAPAISGPTAGFDQSKLASGMANGKPAGSAERSQPGAPVDSTDPQKSEPVALATATPTVRSSSPTGMAPMGLGDLPTGRLFGAVPRVYQPRLEPDRSLRARTSGASVESELAVERALDWLTRHQDVEDGRWDAGIARYDDGSPVKGDDDYTKHCPPGETCFGECAYWEADTALTGLALLTYLGAGYTHTRGRYADPVGKGLNFLLSQQKRDGDLRGESVVVGMYCHAMATLAICEAYALTGDDKLRSPTERAVAFLVRARARDGLAWRYGPRAPVGDTSILGWVVMGLKSAKETRIAIPNEDEVRRGTLDWLDKVTTGTSKGLARYQPWDPVTPTMTAEAWVCRQFMGVGGPGPPSSEAAEYLLRNDSDRGRTNVYYWYYATLALYQHGGEPWLQWNAKIRDRVVNLQHRSGHQSGSWDPDESLYGSKGGRIYCTTLAALTLEVYYRYLRLYDAPTIPTEAAPVPTATGEETAERVLPALRLSNPDDR